MTQDVLNERASYLIATPSSEMAMDFVQDVLLMANQMFASSGKSVVSKLRAKENESGLSYVNSLKLAYRQMISRGDLDEQQTQIKTAVAYVLDIVTNYYPAAMNSKNAKKEVVVDLDVIKNAVNKDWQRFAGLRDTLRFAGRSEMDRSGVEKRGLPTFVFTGDGDIVLPENVSWKMNVIASAGTQVLGSKAALGFFVDPAMTASIPAAASRASQFIQHNNLV